MGGGLTNGLVSPPNCVGSVEDGDIRSQETGRPSYESWNYFTLTYIQLITVVIAVSLGLAYYTITKHWVDLAEILPKLNDLVGFSLLLQHEN